MPIACKTLANPIDTMSCVFRPLINVLMYFSAGELVPWLETIVYALLTRSVLLMLYYYFFFVIVVGRINTDENERNEIRSLRQRGLFFLFAVPIIRSSIVYYSRFIAVLPKCLSHIANIVPACAFGSLWPSRAAHSKQHTLKREKQKTRRKKKTNNRKKTHGKTVGFVWFGYSSVYQPCVYYNWGLYPYIRVRRKNIWLQHTTLDTFSWMFSGAHIHTGVAAHWVAVCTIAPPLRRVGPTR